MQRKAGVLMHISSLWGDYSSGSLGKEAREWIDFLRDAGFGFWQMLPFCIPDECHSPYKSYSAFSLNPYFIDPEALKDKGLLTSAELEGARQKTPYLCEFDSLDKTRMPLLRLAAMRAKNDITIKNGIDKFLQTHPYSADFCTFMARKEYNSGSEWTEWKNGNYDEDTRFTWAFTQYEFMRQWQELHAYASSRGVRLIGDIPIYVAYDSCDLMTNRPQFLLGDDGKPRFVAGVPPDYFCPDGQMWGNPLYDWEKMKNDGYRWWSARISHMLELFDGVRIDHFRGLSSFFAIPAEAENAKSGKWMPGPGLDFTRKIKELAGDKLIIAEDLGDIDDAVYRLVEDSGFPGMRVFQFGWNGEPNCRHLPHTYEGNCVSYTGTHDNNTLLGFYLEADESLREKIRAYCGFTGDRNDCHGALDSIMRTMYSSHSDLVIFPVQDLLQYGADTRMNTPGLSEQNWAYRMTRDQLMQLDRSKYRRLAELYGRL